MKELMRKRALRRLKIVEGQVRGLQRMVEREEYCVNVIRQSTAVKEALSGVEDILLEHHLATHVADQVKEGKTRRAVSEVLSLYKLAKKK